MWKPARALRVSEHDREVLEALVRSGRTAQRVVLRANIILGAARGEANNRLAKELGVSRPTILLWRERYRQAGVDGLMKDAPRPGRRKKVSAQKVEAILATTLNTKPRDATHWST